MLRAELCRKRTAARYRNSTACAVKKPKGGAAHENAPVNPLSAGFFYEPCRRPALRHLCGVVAENMCKGYLPDRSFRKCRRSSPTTTAPTSPSDVCHALADLSGRL
ncbi:MAG: hypothetical protein ACLS37_10880 [Alistipes sp.]